jgi:hypothetical protein
MSSDQEVENQLESPLGSVKEESPEYALALEEPTNVPESSRRTFRDSATGQFVSGKKVRSAAPSPDSPEQVGSQPLPPPSSFLPPPPKAMSEPNMVFTAEQFKEFLKTVSAAATPKSSTVRVDAPKKNYAATPSKFDGDKAKFRAWRQALELYVVAIDDDEDKIAAALSYMNEGTASTWVSNHQTRLREGTWEEFLTALDVRFKDPQYLQKVRDDLWKLKVQDWDVPAYFTKFEELAGIAGIGLGTTTSFNSETGKVLILSRLDDVWRDRIEKALPRELWASMAGKFRSDVDTLNVTLPLIGENEQTVTKKAIMDLGPTYEELRDTANELYMALKPIATNGAGTSGRSQKKGKWSSKEKDDKEEPKASGSSEKVCYNCSKTGHIARNCPEPRKKRADKTEVKVKVRAVSSEETKEDSKESKEDETKRLLIRALAAMSQEETKEVLGKVQAARKGKGKAKEEEEDFSEDQ